MFSQGIPESRERGCGITQAPGRYFALRHSGGGGSWRGKAGSPYRRPAGSAWAKGNRTGAGLDILLLVPAAASRATGAGGSVLDLPGSDPLHASTHARQLFGRMPDPVDKLTDNAQWLAAAKRLCRIPGELLVGDIGVVFELACRLDEVDPPGAFTSGEFGSPGRGVERGGEVT